MKNYLIILVAAIVLSACAGGERRLIVQSPCNNEDMAHLQAVGASQSEIEEICWEFSDGGDGSGE